MPNPSENSAWNHHHHQDQDFALPPPGILVATGAVQTSSDHEENMPTLVLPEPIVSLAHPDESMSNANPPSSSSASIVVDTTVFRPPAEDVSMEHSPKDLAVGNGHPGPSIGLDESPSVESLPHRNVVELSATGGFAGISGFGPPGALQLSGLLMLEHYSNAILNDDDLRSIPSPPASTSSVMVQIGTPRDQSEEIEPDASASLGTECGPEVECEVARPSSRYGHRIVKKYRIGMVRRHIRQRYRQGNTKTGVFGPHPYTDLSATTTRPLSNHGPHDETEGAEGASPVM